MHGTPGVSLSSGYSIGWDADSMICRPLFVFRSAS